MVLGLAELRDLVLKNKGVINVPPKERIKLAKEMKEGEYLITRNVILGPKVKIDC